jgi:osomolarity two-component system sensor histidine kinase SLN1
MVYQVFEVHWTEFKKRLGTGTAPSTSSVHEDSTTGSIHGKDPVPGQPEDEVDEVVVDREWTEDARKTTTKSESAHPFNDSRHPAGTNTDHESFAVVEGFWARSTILIILRWRLWPAILGFFWPRFMDVKSEAQYTKSLGSIGNVWRFSLPSSLSATGSPRASSSKRRL